jgi:hypothetical protein
MTPSGRVALPGLPPSGRMARGSTPPPMRTVPAHAPAVQPRRAPSASEYEQTRVHDQRRKNIKKVYR